MQTARVMQTARMRSAHDTASGEDGPSASRTALATLVQWQASIRLATLISALAVAVTLLLAAADLAAPVPIVIAVVIIGFSASWAQCRRAAPPG